MSASDPNVRRLQLIEQVLHLPDASLDAVECYLASLHPGKGQTPPTGKQDWPHAPVHRISDVATYMVTASTLNKVHIFRSADRLDSSFATPKGGPDTRADRIGTNRACKREKEQGT